MQQNLLSEATQPKENILILNIYGENHCDSKDQVRKKMFERSANEGNLFLIKEGCPLNPQARDIYGIEDALLLNYSVTLRVFSDANLDISIFMNAYKLEDESKIPEVMKTLDKLIKNKHEKSAAFKKIKDDFTIRIVPYVRNLFSLANIVFIRPILEENKLLQPIIDIFNSYQNCFNTNSYIVEPDRFDINFFEMVFGNIAKWNNIIKARLLPEMLTQILTTYDSKKYPNLNIGQLTDLLKNQDYNSYKNHPHQKEVTIDMRNDVFFKNILFILNQTVTSKKPFYFIVGDQHIKGLKAIFESRLSEYKVLNLRIEYFPTVLPFQFFKQPEFTSINSHCAPVCLPPMP